MFTHFSEQPPTVVYQAQKSSKGGMDSSTPLRMVLTLSPDSATALQACTPGAGVEVNIRRFDGCACEMYHEATNTMRTMQLSQTLFSYTLAETMLQIYVQRKHLPVSATLGKAPFMFVVIIKPTLECVMSRQFLVCSKEVEHKIRLPPKRRRAPSAKIIFLESSAEDLLYVGPPLDCGAEFV